MTVNLTVAFPVPPKSDVISIQSAKDCALQAQPAAILMKTLPEPPWDGNGLGLSSSSVTRASHETEVVVEEVVDVVDGGVGSGALGSDRSIEVLANESGLGEQVLVPGAPPAQSKLCGPSVPENSRSAVHPDVVFAVSAPLNVPPVSSGFTAPPNSPVTVPVVPLPMT